VIVKPTAQSCKAYFTFTIKDSTIHFNSEGSVASSPDDSITSRTWYYMDSVQSISLAGNVINPSYTYAKPGTYTVYLLIRTKNGCESKYAGTVVITRPTPVNCTGTEVVFHAERTGLKKIQFNSSASHAIAGDSIIQRRWKFGDGTGLEGNVVSPLKEFPIQGVYNTCLQVKTARGCETQVCKQVVVQDSLGLPETTVDYIRIVSINPNPVAARMMVTIWSRNNNVEAEIAIYDIYGTGKMTIKKVLAQGNNIIEITASALYHGPYFLKISSRNGKDTKAFYKL
jgi:PKD repeat protein